MIRVGAVRELVGVLRGLGWAAFGVLGCGGVWAATNVTFQAEVAVKESYDSNVYLQDTAPAPGAVNAVQPEQASWVTTVLPRLGLSYRPGAAFGVNVAYAPEVAVYHSEHGEDYVAHRVTLALSGKSRDTAWEQSNAFTYTDGNRLGPIFGAPGAVPAIGGIPLRDRREAFIYRGGFKLTYPVGRWFLRPVATAYLHDFMTEQHDPRVAPYVGYENYIDRQDVSGGVDVGLKCLEEASVVLGYRFGRQDQYQLLGVDSPYDSAYHRLLVGLEGTLLPGLKVAILGGPDLRDFADNPDPAFDPDEVLYWIDASVTWLPGKRDSVTLACRRYEQPAFSSHSVYEDITYDVTWKHTFSSRVSARLGFRAYLGDWQAPVDREDWIYTPGVSVTWAITDRLGWDFAYAYDWVESKVPRTEGREYTRHLVSMGLRYTL